MDEWTQEANSPTKLDLSLWKKLIPYFTKLKTTVILLVISTIMSAAVDATMPLFTRYAISNFVVPQTTDGLGSFVIVYVIVTIIYALETFVFTILGMNVEMKMGRELKDACFVHLQKLPLSFYNTTPVGYIIARVLSDTNRISGMVAWIGSNFLWTAFHLTGILITMFILNARLALAACAILPLLLVISLLFQPKIIRANREIRRINSSITRAFNESITGAKTIKTLAVENKVSEEFDSVTSDMRRASLYGTRLNAVYTPIISFFCTIVVAVILYRSGVLVMSDALDFGVMSVFITYGITIMDPVMMLSTFFSEILAAQVNIERITTLLNQPCTISDSPEIEEIYGGVFNPKPENWEKIHGDIEFDHVWFKYPDAAEGDYVLEDVTLKVPAGTTVAIVGETGAGKSTLVNLACRFYEPTRGRILIDGVDYMERGQIWLHSNVGYVQQSPHLFSGTVKDNIRYGKLDATDEEVKASAELVSADVVANKLENGYDTNVGEGGDRLSTGEKQLISFARAVIADPPIFVLDEATSSIDTETELLIQNAISHLLKGRTSFIIAHRLSTIRNADLILLVDEHGIKERGSHKELMAKRGQYYSLYTAMMIKDELNVGTIPM